MIIQLKKENNDLISDDYEKACLLNNYFCSISTLNDSNTSKPDFPLRTNATLDFLSPFLKSGITDAVFHCVGNSVLESDKLNKRERGTQTVLHVFLSI
jgi:hypothetical protein